MNRTNKNLPGNEPATDTSNAPSPHTPPYVLRFGLLAASLIGLLSAHAIWRIDYLPATHDGLHHIFRLYALDQAIRAGDWFPTRFPSMSFGYGSAVLDYYPPLALYTWEALRLTGLGFVKTFQVGYTFFAVVAALSSYRLGSLLRDPWMGLVTAFVYTFSPYVLFDLYARGALSEYVALALAPLLLITLHRAIVEDRLIRWLAFSASVALIVYAHFLSLLLFLPLLAAYTVCLWISGVGRRPATVARLLGAGLLGLLLSAFYWLPALVERGGVHVPGSGDALAAYVAGILPLGQLFSTDFTFGLGYSSTNSVQLANLPLGIGLLGASTVALWQILHGQRRDKILFVGALTSIGILLILVIAPSESLWRVVSPITLLQFPFRWLGPASLSLALLVGAAASVLWGSSRLRLWAMILVSALVISQGIAVFFSLQTREPATLRSLGVLEIREEHIDHRGLLAYEYDEVLTLSQQDHWAWALEYIPATSILRDVDILLQLVSQSQPLSSDLPTMNGQLDVLTASVNQLHATVTNDAAWRLSLHAFAIPGWRARVDGQDVAVQPTSAARLAGIEVPAGTHDVEIWYGWTTLRRISAALSLFALIAWLVAAVRSRPFWVVATLCVVSGFGGLGFVSQRQTPDPPLVQPADVSFAGVFDLSAYGVAVHQDEVQVDLVWLTRRTVAESYKIFVHVIDDQGKLWRQADAYPRNFASRTNRWAPGQVTFDAHRFDLPPDMPPGRYQVRIGLYLESDGQRVPVVDDMGQPIDDQVLLETIDVGSIDVGSEE